MLNHLLAARKWPDEDPVHFLAMRLLGLRTEGRQALAEELCLAPTSCLEAGCLVLRCRATGQVEAAHRFLDAHRMALPGDTRRILDRLHQEPRLRALRDVRSAVPKWFEPGTMISWRSKIHGELEGGTFFISSEAEGLEPPPRRYTLRAVTCCDKEGWTIWSVGDFTAFFTLAEARRSLGLLLRLLKGPRRLKTHTHSRPWGAAR